MRAAARDDGVTHWQPSTVDLGKGPERGGVCFCELPAVCCSRAVAYTYVDEARILTARRQLLPCCCCMLRHGHLVFCGVLVIGGGCSACG